MPFSFLTRQRRAVYRSAVPSAGRMDLYCHILPGLDDGPHSLDQSVAIARQLNRLGFHRLVITPHIMKGYYEPSPDRIRSITAGLQQALRAEGVNLSVEPAAEYYLDDGFLSVLRNRGDLLVFSPSQEAPKSLVLVETSLITLSDAWLDALDLLRSRGFVPVLSHSERYIYLQQNRGQAIKLRDQGVLFHMDLLSLTGRNGLNARHFAEWLIDQNVISFVGANVNSESQFRGVREALSLPYGKKIIG